MEHSKTIFEKLINYLLSKVKDEYILAHLSNRYGVIEKLENYYFHQENLSINNCLLINTGFDSCSIKTKGKLYFAYSRIENNYIYTRPNKKEV